MSAIKKRPVAIFLIIVFLLITLFFVYAMNSKQITIQKTYSPQTDYASQFIKECENEKWLLDETERLLNMKQSSVDNLTTGDLDHIVSLGMQGKKIKGKIPKAIKHFRNLEYLFLSDNELE